MAISNVIPAKPAIKPDIIVPHYVSGRKLTAQDLQTERDASLKRLEFIGRAAGVGIVEGLWVESSGALGLTITGGLGINEQGHPIFLKDAATINLAPTPTDTTTTTKPQIKFASCNSPSTANTTGLKDGPYLLTVSPVYNLSNDFVQVQKILPRGTQDDCTNKSEEESVNFRVVFLGDAYIPHGFHIETDTNKAAYLQRRNLLAHWAFGTEERLLRGSNPFQDWKDLDYSGFGLGRSKFEAAGDLTACDLRLAVFFLETIPGKSQSIQFVDNWAVRRRPSHPSQFQKISTTGTSIPLSGWGQRLNDQLSAEGEARFAQFQEHLDDLRQKLKGATWAANQYMYYLPAAGYVPLSASSKLLEVITQYVLDFFRDEIQKSSTNPRNAQLRVSDTPPIQVILTAGQQIGFPGLVLYNTHVTDEQMNALISTVNTVFGNITNVANKLASISLQKSISLKYISSLKGSNDPAAEVAANGHVLASAYNNRILKNINDWFADLKSLVNQLAVPFNTSVNDAPLSPLPGPDNNLQHIDINGFNNQCINPLNDIIVHLVSTVNGVISGGSNAWNAVNVNFDQLRTDISTKLMDNLSSSFTTNPDSVAVENFFAKTADTSTSYIKNLAFTDRQTVETIVGNSWHLPAIDLSKNDNLSLIMVYEDVIPYIVGRLKSVIEDAQAPFTNQDNLLKIWKVDVSTEFDAIAELQKGKTSPPIYGLFSQAIYPLQTRLWQQVKVTLDEPVEADNIQSDVVEDDEQVAL